jgi:hypothetical protein
MGLVWHFGGNGRRRPANLNSFIVSRLSMLRCASPIAESGCNFRDLFWSRFAAVRDFQIWRP